MIVYNPTTDRYELYSTAALAYGTDPRYLRGLFSSQFAAWCALCHHTWKEAR
jgi:hypothetical protein